MNVSLEDFKKLDVQIGTVRVAEIVPGTDKLLRLEVDFGDENLRQILSGIAEFVQPVDIIGRQFPFITNLEPRVIRGLVSNGMLLAVGEGEAFALLSPIRPVTPGSRIR
jgi:methionine--tRNA ligase beta chain